ncbi:arylformamidase [Jezberella montanilacus]|jgi:arylformamidase|uniref:Arylformamidase n=1 Tax=Jezberella montanilacus TaxID=323426 RepID=A0A2T0XJU1_9BURK|nr:alpha/beta hydrolase [Jezberella montanilacus]PRY99206.1 arylformamidase [Jezberella montanilacus]
MNEAVEREFNPRVSVPDTEPYIKRGAEQSAKAYATHEHQSDLSYAPGDLTTLDYFPCGQPGRPLFVFIHGGFWRGRDKKDFAYVANSMLPTGCNVALMNYDLCPTVTVTQITQQIRDGLVWLSSQATKLGFKSGLLVAGHSAGAHLLAMTLAKTGQSYQLPDQVVNKAYLISGIYDCSPVLEISVNEEIRMTEQEVPLMSPIRFAMPAGVQYEVLAGGAEPAGWVKQSTDFAEHLHRHGCNVNMQLRPGLNHYSILQEFETSDGYLPQLIQRDLKA